MSQENRRSTLATGSFDFSIFQYFFRFSFSECFFKLLDSFERLILFNLRVNIFKPFIRRITAHSDLKFLKVFIFELGVCIVMLIYYSIKNCLVFKVVGKQILFQDIIFSILTLEIAKNFIILEAKWTFIGSKFFWFRILLCFKKINYQIPIGFWKPNQSNITAIILFTFVVRRNQNILWIQHDE